MITAKEVAHRLAGNAEAVAMRLLPGGQREGREWVCGSVAGESGKSLKVCLSGERAGLWADFAGGDSGDLLDLWAAVRRVSIADALKEARDYLGIQAPAFAGSSPRTYRRPDKPAASRPKGRVLEYLHSRGLTDPTIAAYRVAASPDDDEIVFPFLRNDELVNCKYLKLDRPGGKKIVRQEKDAEPCLFGWQAIPPTARSVVICEGEIDAMTWFQSGYPALSVWSGAGNLQWVENEWERLAAFDTIYIAFDRDEAGEKGALALVERLGRAVCRIVRTPYKDANECLQRGCDRVAFRELIDEAQSLDPRELRSASAYKTEVMARLFPKEGDRIGWQTPFEKLEDRGVRFNPAELILINGINGHGKTSFSSQIVLSLLRQGAKACIASMEIKPAMLLERMTKQACALPDPSEPFAEHVQDYWQGKLWIFEHVGSAKGQYLLSVFRYARARYGITTFVIDSLTKCGFADDDYKGQKEFVEALCDFKNETDSTVFLVTHSRKLESEHQRVDKMDIKGTGSIADLADTITTLWRNKRKEEDPTGAQEDEPDSRWLWQKNRNGDFEGTVRLWYDAPCYQYRDVASRKSRPYVTLVRPLDMADDTSTVA